MKYDPAVKQEVIELRKSGLSYSNIAKAVGLPESGVWRILQENPVPTPTVKNNASHSLIKETPVKNAVTEPEDEVTEEEEAAEATISDADITADYAEHLYALTEELEKSDLENQELSKKLDDTEKKLKNLKNRYDALEKGAEKTRVNQQETIAKQKAELEKVKKEHAVQIEQYKSKLGELKNKEAELPSEFAQEFDTLERENRDLKAKLLAMDSHIQNKGQSQPQNEMLITYGFEKDFFPSEIREFVLEALEEYVRNHDNGKRSRKNDCIKDVLDNNVFERIHTNRREELSNAFKKADNDYSKVTPVLEKLGFQKVASNNHVKWVYHDDPRYTTSLSVTPSDCRAVKNVVSEMLNEFF